MAQYIFRRLLGLIPLLIGITMLSFAVIHLAPGKPTAIEQSMNPRVSPEVQARLMKLYDLDKPLPVQYFKWVKRLVKFDLGRSFVDNRPVTEKILERIPITLAINIAALIIILSVGIPFGVISALKPNGLFDRITTLFVFLCFAMPTFWLALLLINLFSIQLGWVPVSGIKSIDFEYFTWPHKIIDLSWHLILPVFVSSIAGLAGTSRYMRANMLDTLQQPYIAAARAKGLPEQTVLYKHALPNAILPIVTILGLSIPGLLGGSVIFESIFSIPGIGRLFYEAVMTRDYPLIMAEIVLTAVLTMLGNLLADISYAYVDPRIRYQNKK